MFRTLSSKFVLGGSYVLMSQESVADDAAPVKRYLLMNSDTKKIEELADKKAIEAALKQKDAEVSSKNVQEAAKSPKVAQGGGAVPTAG